MRLNNVVTPGGGGLQYVCLRLDGRSGWADLAPCLGLLHATQSEGCGGGARVARWLCYFVRPTSGAGQ